MSDQSGSTSGLSSREAQEFHKYFMTGFLVFTAIAIVAHFLVWQWQPWL
jgi:light-harvesting complex 1 beta chain